MKATSLREYQNKFQPAVSLYIETAWSERKAQISKNVAFWFFFVSVQAVFK
jgi:hypothetical protein